MTATTIKQATANYDEFHGGTREENAASAQFCLGLLREAARKAEVLISHPSKRFTQSWYFSALQDIPARVEAFAERYSLQ